MTDRVAIYARISTKEGRQFLQNQVQSITRHATTNGWRIVETITDEHTGTKEAPGWRKVLDLARQRKIARVIVWKLDRVTRQGPAYAFRQLHLLSQHGCSLVSVQEPMFDSAGPFGPVLIALAAWIAEFETVTQRERVKAGLRRAQQEGTKLGRPRLVFDRQKLADLRKENKGLDLISRALGISRASANRYIKALEEEQTHVDATNSAARGRHAPPPPNRGTSTRGRAQAHQGTQEAATGGTAPGGNLKTVERPAKQTRNDTTTAARPATPESTSITGKQAHQTAQAEAQAASKSNQKFPQTKPKTGR